MSVRACFACSVGLIEKNSRRRRRERGGVRGVAARRGKKRDYKKFVGQHARASPFAFVVVWPGSSLRLLLPCRWKIEEKAAVNREIIGGGIVCFVHRRSRVRASVNYFQRVLLCNAIFAAVLV